ncbi:hypothetical protein VEL88_004038 [Cronobacter sakazakii]|uniref:Ead/Ea22-like family protein n=2 Tax=Cronobacter TaxID=413496 RepID=A7MHQ5_CROS8|nr:MULTISPECIES: hypothetical protein [Cronobacter]ABU76263.1 hypothetical protein ESA_00994 [Cronobacter sakazakii ATCC BAA-894]ELY3381573.1 hypothetical protein [Cronobacter sakazakii]ELY3437947.1 hypothetical protein [Cronobacter sakazakii]ELY5799944.1 hypothetical protein [Cronobacter sakazakii]EMC4132985.1 hypothetical protein [Cronobacter sakazakii]
MNTAKLKVTAGCRDLLGVQKHANQHRLSRLVMEVHNDELRIIAAAVESYTDELIAALEAKDAQIAELLEKQRLIDICQGQGLEHRIAAERRAEAAEKRVAELERQAIQPLPIGELINRLEEQTGEPWGEVYLAGINLRRGESDHG